LLDFLAGYITAMTTYQSIDEIKAANRAAGEYWFSPVIERQFDPHAETPIMAGRFWVESINNHNCTGRTYLLCVARDNGVVVHLGGPKGLLKFNTRLDAVTALAKLLDSTVG